MGAVSGTILTTCSICGKETEWEESLGDMPLCIDCWDRQVDKYNPYAEKQRQYYQEHKKELAEKQRLFEVDESKLMEAVNV